MSDALIAEKLYGQPAERTSKAGKPFVVAKVRQAKRIEANRLLPGDVKRERLTELDLQRGHVAKRLSKMMAG